jgi:small subunit ribosomal protein S20
MPHNLSAKKRLRQNEVRRLRNKSRVSELKTLRKKLLRAIQANQKAEAETLYREFSKSLDQAAAVRTLHKNSAARSKQRLALKIQAISAQPAAAT